MAEPRCPRCKSTRWVSVSLDSGFTRKAQCVPCGAYHSGTIGPGWKSRNFYDPDASHPDYRCGARDPDRLHRARGEHTDALLDRLLVDIADLDQPPTETQARDLFAHAREYNDDAERAARWVLVVLDLGWRPADFGGGA